MQTQIIVFGKQTMEFISVLKQVSKKEEWEIFAMLDVETAIEMMHRQNVNMIIFVDVEEIDKNKLRKIGTILNEDIAFLNYRRQPSVEKEVVALLNRQRLEKQAEYSFTDDTLKYANWNISLN